MEKDPDTRGIIVGMIRKVNEEDWKNLIKKICRDAKSVIIFILGIVVTICVQKFFQ
jgi:succinyl-CoA synthetase alpha subunit